MPYFAEFMAWWGISECILLYEGYIEIRFLDPLQRASKFWNLGVGFATPRVSRGGCHLPGVMGFFTSSQFHHWAKGYILGVILVYWKI